MNEHVMLRSEPSFKKATALGYVACDVTIKDDVVIYSAGGTSANVSANLAVLGWQVILHARIGIDVAGQVIHEDLENDGVELAESARDPEVSTPVVIVEANSRSPKYRFRCPHCGTPYARHRPVREVDVSTSADSNVVFLDRTSAAGIELAERARRSGQTVFFEPNGLGSERLFKRMIGIADIVKYSNDRADDFRIFLDDANPQQVQICTFGSDGFAVRYPHSDWRRYRAPATAAVDSVGAGDMFTAALLDLLAEELLSGPPSIKQVTEAAAEAQWFAVAQVKREGPRGLTRGRSRAEVLAEVASVRAGNDRTIRTWHQSNALPIQGCESLLCRRGDVEDAKRLTANAIYLRNLS
jgi:sugar/nucleoside kinase (ribokinase family)